MSFHALRKGLLALVISTAFAAGCQPPNHISTADDEKGNRPNSSTGLGDLKPDAGSAPRMDPPNNIQPWPDAGIYPDTAPTGKDEKCAAEKAAAKQVPVDLLLLVDRSGSMAETAGVGGQSRWVLAQEALVAFIKDSKSAGMGVGVQYFPVVTPCSTNADCTGGFLASCIESKVCVGAGGAIGTPPVSCTARPTLCTGGTTCVPLGRCSETGAACTNLNDACPGGAATNKCIAQQKTCREGAFSLMCMASDYQKMAVPVGELPMAMGPLAVSLMSTLPSGGTPTAPAAEAVLSHLRMRATAHPDRYQAMVVVTDGMPNTCREDPNDPLGLIKHIAMLIGDAKAAMPSIPTYAIGVFSPDPEELMAGTTALETWATAGGTMKPFVLTSGGDLTQKLLDALNTIRGSALPCEYMIPKPATGNLDYGKVNVHVTGSGVGPMGLDLGYVTDASKCDPVKGGWHYDVNPTMGTPTRVIMCEATCKKFKMDATANIELRFGCQTVPIQ